MHMDTPHSVPQNKLEHISKNHTKYILWHKWIKLKTKNKQSEQVSKHLEIKHQTAK